jgi:hypothetical protein
VSFADILDKLRHGMLNAEELNKIIRSVSDLYVEGGKNSHPGPRVVTTGRWILAINSSPPHLRSHSSLCTSISISSASVYLGVY